MNNYDKILNDLQNISNNLNRVMELTGVTARVEIMKAEIKLLGWDVIEKNYHPSNNIADPARIPLFEMYIAIYEMMKKNGEIE
jgi:hypothetical protein